MPRRERDGRFPANFAEKQQKITQRGDVGKHGRDGCTGDLQPEHKDEQRVERHVQHAAEGNADARLPGIALGANQMRQLGAEHRRNGADADRPEYIGHAVAQRFLVRAEDRQQHRPERQRQQPVEQRDGRARPDAERGGMRRLFAVFQAEAARDQARAADAEQVGLRRHQHEQRHGDRCGGNLIRVVELADVIGVGHVIDHGDDLTDDRRQRQRRDGSADRRRGE